MGKPLTIADGNAFFDLPKIGQAVEYLDGGGTKGRVYRKDFDTIEIHTKLGQITTRTGYEKQLKFTMPGFIRAHALGPIVGHESPHGIYPAPTHVNYKIQEFGAEKFVRAIGKNIRGGQTLYITATVVRQTLSHQVGNELMKIDFLKQITYTVHPEFGKTGTRIFEVGFDVAKPNDVKSKVLFSNPFISADFNKYCKLDNVLKSTEGTGIHDSVRKTVAKAPPPPRKRVTAKSSDTSKAKTTPTQSLPKAPATYTGTQTSDRFTNPSQRGLSGKLSSTTRSVASHLAKFTANAGRTLIKQLPTIMKGVSIYTAIKSLYAIFDAIDTTLKTFSHGTPIPEFEKELGEVLTSINEANRAVNAIYEDNILLENHPAIEDELYNLGDKESLDRIVGLLMEESSHMSQMKDNLIESHTFMVELQKDLYKASNELFLSLDTPGFETWSKGQAILMGGALKNNANGLTTPIEQTRRSIETLDSLLAEYNGLIDFYNDTSWTLQILRNHDSLGMALPASIVAPTGSVWGPDVR